jgi:geranylgeranyl transferase type-2 subunit alpha
LPFILSFRSELTETQSFQVQLELAREELDIIRNAIFTEPDDQTCWWYLRFIVDWSNPVKQKRNVEHCENDIDNLVEEYKDILYQEWLTISELVEAEEGRCKWGLLALHMIAMIFLEGDNDMKDTRFQGEDWMEHAQAYVSQLKMLDPDRYIRYDSLLKP